MYITKKKYVKDCIPYKHICEMYILAKFMEIVENQDLYRNKNDLQKNCQ